MKFPPPEAPAKDVIEYMDALEDECLRDPNRQAWDQSKQRWLDLYTGNHFAEQITRYAPDLEPELRANRPAVSAICKVVYNRIMNAVLAMYAGQISNPPRVVFGARENGEPPIYYLNGFVQHPALQQIALMAGAQDESVKQAAGIYPPGHPEIQQTAIQAGQSVPLPPELVDQVKLLIDQGKMMTAQARLAMMPPPVGIVPPEALVEITDQTTAQFTQTVFDALWEQCGGIEATGECILNKKVLGFQPTLFESDRHRISYGESPVTLTNIEGDLVYLDPMTSSFRPPRYQIMLEPVSLEEGIAKYPDLEDVLRAKADSGTLNARMRNASGRRINLQYSREMCVVRTLWHRDWAYPMDPDEAVSCGKVLVQNVPTGQMETVTDDYGQPVGQKDITRQMMVLAETGEETNPELPNWPVIHAIREVREIGGEVVFDRRCRLPTIPIVNNINIPVPFSPYGLGEGDRLDGLQMAINRVLSDLITQHRYNAYPPEVAHEVVCRSLGGTLRKARIKPDQLIRVGTDAAAAVGGDLSKLTTFMDIPPMSEGSWRLLEFLVEAIDKEANNTDVQQGEAPPGSSGTWVANLQAAANQVAQVTSQSTEAWLKQIVRLFVHFISKDMTDQDVMKYTAKYPPAIVEAFRRKQKNLYLDIAVEIQSGSAAAKQGQTQGMVMARQGGMTVSEPSILERMNLDPDAELKREAEWIAKKRDSGLADQQAEDQVQKEKEPSKQPAA